MILKTPRNNASTAFLITLASLFIANALAAAAGAKTVMLSKEALLDKIKGGWAAQTIGVTYGGPTEFKYKACTIPDSVEIPWPGKGYVRQCIEKKAGLYDDIYMDLSFMLVFEKEGIDAPARSLANAFAHAGYKLWHANQAARYNLLNGIQPPQSGHWKNNPHADDIDFQIEADFAGLMSPGMPNTASAICDKVGHIMNYGDGWYGGVYVAAMYSLAFIDNDIERIVKNALKTIPPESTFHQCISDTIRWSAQNPDWRVTWRLLQDKWANEIGCPRGVWDAFDIDAKINAAYIVMGLLYGKGDMTRTLEISTRCGADSDCNPASAGGILGTMLGYKNIPAKWLDELKLAENTKFPQVGLSLNEVYQMGFGHALKVIAANGGQIESDRVVIKSQTPVAVPLEQSFENLEVVSKEHVSGFTWEKDFNYRFQGTGIVIEGKALPQKTCPDEYVAHIELTLDGKTQTVPMPVNFNARRFDIYWNYDLPPGAHVITLKWANQRKDVNLILDSFIVYAPKR